MAWINLQCAFAVENYFRKNKSVSAVRHAFRIQFKIPPSQTVPDRKSIILWVKNFRETIYIIRNGGGRHQSAENIDTVSF